jgi:hypothetical protein
MKKRGELTTQQLVTLIILITSFVVILFLIFRLNLGEETQKEICHNSVVMLGKKGGLFSELDCATNYICISAGGECEGFNYDSKVQVSLDDENEIVDVLQGEIDDCWWMFGEGKIDYVGSVSLPGYRCAVCSTIKFDERVQEKFESFDFNGRNIFTSVKYSIVTGLDPTLPFQEDKYLNATLVEAVNVKELSCKEFITKA